MGRKKIHENSLKNLRGVPGNAGRVPGSKNKYQMTKQLKDDIFQCYNELGGKDYLAVVATEYPQVFKDLLVKLLPTEIKAEIGRPGDFDNMTDEELDAAIIKKFKAQYSQKFTELGFNAGREGTETVHQEPDPVHQNHPAEVRTGAAPLPDRRGVGTGSQR